MMQKSSNLSAPRASTRSREPAAAPTGVSSAKGQATPHSETRPPGDDSVCRQASPLPRLRGALTRQGNSTCLSHQEPWKPAGKQENEPMAYITM